MMNFEGSKKRGVGSGGGNQVCYNNYEYLGQVYSPAFSDPASSPPVSPMSTGSSAESCVSSDDTARRRRQRSRRSSTSVQQPQEDFLLNESQLQVNFEKLVKIGDCDKLNDFLDQHWQSVDIDQYTDDSRSQTPLQWACLESNLDLVKTLIRFGANWRLTSKDGFSLLHIAAFSGNSELLNYVMSLGGINN